MKGLDHQHHSDKKKPRRSMMEKRAERHAKKLARTKDVHVRIDAPQTPAAH